MELSSKIFSDVFPKRQPETFRQNFLCRTRTQMKKKGKVRNRCPTTGLQKFTNCRVDGLNPIHGASESSHFILKNQGLGRNPIARDSWMRAVWVVVSCFFWMGICVQIHPKLFPTFRDFWKRNFWEN